MSFNAGERNFLKKNCFCFNLFLLTLNLMGGKILMLFKALFFFFFKQAQEIKPYAGNNFS